MGLTLLPKELNPDFNKPKVKPVVGFEIDWDNPLARGLTSFSFPETLRDKVTNGNVSLVEYNGISWSAGVDSGNKGALIESASSGFPYIDTGDANWLPLSLGYTMFFHFRHDAVANGALSITPNGYNAGGIRVSVHDSSGFVNVSCAHFQSGAGQYFSGSGYTQSNTPAVLLISVDEAGNALVALNGEILVQGSGILAPASISNMGRLATQEWAQGLNGAMYAYGKFNRALSAGELIALSNNPYQILRPSVPQYLNTGGGISPPSTFQVAWALAGRNNNIIGAGL